MNGRRPISPFPCRCQAAQAIGRRPVDVGEEMTEHHAGEGSADSDERKSLADGLKFVEYRIEDGQEDVIAQIE